MENSRNRNVSDRVKPRPCKVFGKSWIQIRYKGRFRVLFAFLAQGKKYRKPLIFLGFAVKLLTRIELVTSTLPM